MFKKSSYFSRKRFSQKEDETKGERHSETPE